MVEYFRCRRCLYPNTKPDIWFDDAGLCSACLSYDARLKTNWAAKKDEFIELVRANGSPPWGGSHDVIVACSGGKDSTAQVLKCLELNLRPLAVTATTDHLTPLGRANLDNISRLCDHVEITPNRTIRAKIAKFALQEVGDISWCEHHLIWSIPAQEALNRGIPIVLYGECPQAEYGAGPKGSENAVELTREWVHEFGGLLGLRLSDISDLLNVPRRELDLYRYPENVVGLKSVWMGAYFPWDGYDNYLKAKENGFTPWHGDIEGSIYGYENLDNYQTGIHDRLRFLKFGYSRATDIASNHIRRGRMKREEGSYLCQMSELRPFTSYLGKPLAEILEHIGMTVSEFNAICHRYTSWKLVDWASQPGSYQSYCMTAPMAASKAGSSVTAAA